MDVFSSYSKIIKQLIYTVIIFFSIQTNGQNSTERKRYKVDLLTLEKKTKDTLIGSIIEVFSGEKRIETDITDFDGLSIFHLNSKDIINSKVRLKIHGMKCVQFEKEYKLTDDLNTTILLEYGESEYTKFEQLTEIYKKLNIEPKTFTCGYSN